MNDRMDEVAKSMASGISRRRAFFRMLAGMFGLGALAGTPKQAAAQDPYGICVAENCAHLSGFQRLVCQIRCAFGDNSNDWPF